MGNIEVISAKENNLKNVNVKIPTNKITVVTGVSGSGKSSLVFDTIYAESERMFLESLSMNMQNVTSNLPRPNVYKINNLLPSIAISQKQTNRNPRSYVGTVTDISRFLRLLFAKLGNDKYNKEYTEGDFSYNNPKVWCKACRGTGRKYIIDYDKVIGDDNKSLKDGVILYWSNNTESYHEKLLERVCDYYNIDINRPLKDLESDKMDFILNARSDHKFTIRYKNYKKKIRTKEVEFKGVLLELNELIEQIDTPSIFKSIQKYLKIGQCNKCDGHKLKQEILDVRILGENISTLEYKSLTELKFWLKVLRTENDSSINTKIINEISIEIINRINNLEELGLGYLSLNRSIPTLSGGEIQRVRLANQLACNLSGLLYVLDEPTMGLHSRDIKSLYNILKNLKTKGNTLLMVEHNREIMINADNIIDMGIGGGRYGGEIIAEGSPESIMKNNDSLTGKYLSGNMKINYPVHRRKAEHYLKIKKATFNNINEMDIDIPLLQFVVLTGVSGSGKSTLTEEILIPSLTKKKNINCHEIIGSEKVRRVVNVDQTPIGRTPKSNVATFTGIFDFVRDFYSGIKSSKEKGFTKSHFSFNLEGGRCENCQGDGYIKVDMSFMADTYVPCEQCKGRRYKEDILLVKHKEKNIFDILDMTVLEAYDFFQSEINIRSILKCLIDVGLDYIKLGQSAVTISGGEAQRIKLARYLSDDFSKGNFYVLDEPTVGLHFDDVNKLIKLLNDIVDRGNSLVVIEHNLELIKCADYVIDIGPQGGPRGGKIIDCGSPEEIVRNSKVSVSKKLKEILR